MLFLFQKEEGKVTQITTDYHETRLDQVEKLDKTRTSCNPRFKCKVDKA